MSMACAQFSFPDERLRSGGPNGTVGGAVLDCGGDDRAELVDGPHADGRELFSPTVNLRPHRRNERT
jgi:hypothetical protein